MKPLAIWSDDPSVASTSAKQGQDGKTESHEYRARVLIVGLEALKPWTVSLGRCLGKLGFQLLRIPLSKPPC